MGGGEGVSGWMVMCMHMYIGDMKSEILIYFATDGE